VHDSVTAETPAIHAGPGIAVFDLDGTITHNDTFVPFLLGHLRRTPARWTALPRLAGAAALFYAGRTDNNSLKAAFLKALIAGANPGDLRPCVAAFLDKLMQSGLRRGALEVLTAHRAAGWTTLLATASPDVYVMTLAERLGFDAVVCTQLEQDQAGRFTGGLVGGNCYGAEKAARVAAWRAATPRSGPLWVYTDHHADLPLLDMADRRIGVSPSRRLRDVASSRGISLVAWN
jgi:HAD superfamily hydrolase (TIGR01490 family)